MMSTGRVHRIHINTQLFSRWLLIHHIMNAIYSRCHMRRMTAARMVSLLLQRSCQLWVRQMGWGMWRVDWSATGGWGMNWTANDWLARIRSCCTAVMTIAASRGDGYWTHSCWRLYLKIDSLYYKKNEVREDTRSKIPYLSTILLKTFQFLFCMLMLFFQEIYARV